VATTIDKLAGTPAAASTLVDVEQLVAAYYRLRPDVAVPAQRVAFGTSGHRGTSTDASFNEAHVLAITQAICLYRKAHGIDGPLFIGIDTHALSLPAFSTALEVLAGEGIPTMIARGGEYTPTPAISHAILRHNRNRETGLADGIVVTPSHNPPESGGFKYNPPNGGPADTKVTAWIETRANALLAGDLAEVPRVPFDRALRAATTHEHDFVAQYVGDLGAVIDFDVIRASGIRMGVDPMGGAGVHYWGAIAERYALDLTVISDAVDPQFGFMSLDWDGRIRMDPSSAYAMRRLTAVKDRFDIAFSCDTDHDRHGIVTPGHGLLPANHYLAAMIDYLFQNRGRWRAEAAVGKTLVSSAMIDRVAAKVGCTLREVPVGFKWFVEGLFTGALGFAGEESAGASFARIDGSVWTTDKDGIVPGLLAAEMTARDRRDPGTRYRDLARNLGDPVSDRVEAAATPEQKRKLAHISPDDIGIATLAGEPVQSVLSRAPANDAPIGGIKVTAANGWFAARPSGTEDIYKIYAESFRGVDHLRMLVAQAQDVVDRAIR
jgi:phosphoglucomutase